MSSLLQEIKQKRPFESIAQESAVSLLRTNHLVRRKYDQDLESLGLTLQQYNVLRILKGAGGDLPTMDIGDRLVESTPGVTRLMQRVEKSGLAKSSHGKDKRQRLWSLTTRGKSILTKANAVMKKNNDDVFGGMTKSDTEKFLELLSAVRSRILSE